MARADGVAKAREQMLKIGDDRRVPMREVYSLYAGKITPDDVLAAARSGKPTPAQLNERLFYAHLYVGLYYEAAGDKAKASEHITKAAEKHKIGHYMWDVARVHAERLASEAACTIRRCLELLGCLEPLAARRCLEPLAVERRTIG